MSENLKRVLLCTDYLPPSDGGVEQVVQELAKRLADRGYEVGVFTLRSRDESFHLEDHPDISLFTSRKFDLTGYIGLQSALSIDAIVEFRRVLATFEPDLVHVHNRFFFTSYVGLLYRYLEGYPLVTTLHLGSLDHLDGAFEGVARVLQSVGARQLVRKSDSVLCVSEAVADIARRLGSRRTVTVPNAIDLDRFSVGQREFDKTVLYVGRLVRNNGPQDLIRAVPRVVREHPDAHVHVVGSGEMEPELQRLVAAKGIEDAVTIHGFVDNILVMYEAADVFCRPSYSEGLPLTLLESMATYTVPVVTPVAGVREVLTDGETGRFIEVQNPKSVSKGLNGLLESPETVDRMAQAGRTRVEQQHSWDRRVELITEEYRNVVRYA